MSVVGGIAKAADGAQVLRRTTSTTSLFPKSKWMMVVELALLALVALALVIPASQAPNVEHSSAGTKDSQAGTAVAPNLSEDEALDAYGKLPLSFIPNEGQTDEAVRYYAQGAGYGFSFTKGGAMLSLANGEGRGHALGLDFLGANPHPT